MRSMSTTWWPHESERVLFAIKHWWRSIMFFIFNAPRWIWFANRKFITKNHFENVWPLNIWKYNLNWRVFCFYWTSIVPIYALFEENIPLITLLHLKKISQLKSIFEGRMVCESIERIEVYGCLKLSLPFSLPFINGQLISCC